MVKSELLDFNTKAEDASLQTALQLDLSPIVIYRS